MVGKEGAAQHRHKHHKGGCQGHIEVHRAIKHRRRQRAQQHVAGNTAADGGDHTQHAHAENIHILSDARDGAADGKGHRAEQL